MAPGQYWESIFPRNLFVSLTRILSFHAPKDLGFYKEEKKGEW